MWIWSSHFRASHTNKIWKSLTFCLLFPIMGAFDRIFGKIVESSLSFRGKLVGYRYSEILRSLMCVYFCGGSCIEDFSWLLLPLSSQMLAQNLCSSEESNTLAFYLQSPPVISPFNFILLLRVFAEKLSRNNPISRRCEQNGVNKNVKRGQNLSI